MLMLDYLGRVSAVLLLVIILECDCQMVRDAGLEGVGRGGVGRERAHLLDDHSNDNI